MRAVPFSCSALLHLSCMLIFINNSANLVMELAFPKEIMPWGKVPGPLFLEIMTSNWHTNNHRLLAEPKQDALPLSSCKTRLPRCEQA